MEEMDNKRVKKKTILIAQEVRNDVIKKKINKKVSTESERKC